MNSFQIGEPSAVLSGDDEAELMRVILRALEEGGAIDVVALCIVEPPHVSFTGNAIALDVSDVRTRGAHIAGGDACVARLDDDAAAAWRDEAGCGAHAGAHTSLRHRRCDVAALPHGACAGATGLPQHLRVGAQLRIACGVADAAELWFELVLSHGDTPMMKGVGEIRWRRKVARRSRRKCLVYRAYFAL